VRLISAAPADFAPAANRRARSFSQAGATRERTRLLLNQATHALRSTRARMARTAREYSRERELTVVGSVTACAIFRFQTGKVT
jgi:hypothetical protein